MHFTTADILFVHRSSLSAKFAYELNSNFTLENFDEKKVFVTCVLSRLLWRRFELQIDDTLRKSRLSLSLIGSTTYHDLFYLFTLQIYLFSAEVVLYFLFPMELPTYGSKIQDRCNKDLFIKNLSGNLWEAVLVSNISLYGGPRILLQFPFQEN